MGLCMQHSDSHAIASDELYLNESRSNSTIMMASADGIRSMYMWRQCSRSCQRLRTAAPMILIAMVATNPLSEFCDECSISSAMGCRNDIGGRCPRVQRTNIACCLPLLRGARTSNPSTKPTANNPTRTGHATTSAAVWIPQAGARCLLGECLGQRAEGCRSQRGLQPWLRAHTRRRRCPCLQPHRSLRHWRCLALPEPRRTAGLRPRSRQRCHRCQRASPAPTDSRR